jgi:hypothetical protein
MSTKNIAELSPKDFRVRLPQDNIDHRVIHFQAFLNFSLRPTQKSLIRFFGLWCEAFVWYDTLVHDFHETLSETDAFYLQCCSKHSTKHLKEPHVRKTLIQFLRQSYECYCSLESLLQESTIFHVVHNRDEYAEQLVVLESIFKPYESVLDFDTDMYLPDHIIEKLRRALALLRSISEGDRSFYYSMTND